MESNYQQASIKTANDLRTIAQSQSVQELSNLSLPEINAVVDLTAKIIPAGNVPGMILSGLARIPGQRLPFQSIQQHMGILFKGVEQVLDHVAFGAIFAGPAAVIWGYQNLLKLAGKNENDAFPEGIWQFYADYALREDTARHVNETHGFDTLLQQHGVALSEVDRLTAWTMAAISCLHQYNSLLEIEWREKVATSLLEELTRDLHNAEKYTGLYREWEIQRPYRRGAEAANYAYPNYRRLKFDHFLGEALQGLPAPVRAAWETAMQTASREELPAYQRQMSIMAYLEPGSYAETRVSFPFAQSQIGIIHQANYYLIPACAPGGNQPISVQIVREQIATILNSPVAYPANLVLLSQVKRASLPDLRPRLTETVRKKLEQLRFAPIIINSDARPASLPLTELRQAERGTGDHALTVFDTGKTFVFDQSHIFFDGNLGAALAEIMTNEALSWAAYLRNLPAAQPAAHRLYTPLNIQLQPTDLDLIRRAPQISSEAGAETDKVNLKACMTLRRLFKQRNTTIKLTVNDLLVLYRAIHAANYQPSLALRNALNELTTKPETASLANEIWDMFETSRTCNPSMLIPMDASNRVPRNRLYPISMEVPLTQLKILELHGQVMLALDEYEKTSGDRAEQFARFNDLQLTYLATLAGFSAISARLKEIALQGESVSVGAIKMLAHMPPIFQQIMVHIPDHFELLNNIIKGQEVFSNVGAVVATSTLSRFVTAKDDNGQKQLVWGVLTDSEKVMHISLRDFRPHVAALYAIGRKDLANLITQDYLETYAEGFNSYIRDLRTITAASRKTRLLKKVQS